ncbi:hypothetical protein M569_12148 [Genlisea aurea]|uniref:Uncharacterized protein n=1 Tax=Genlisea aurea TaxID=192259 RepID=S8CDS0_9LAMI|nr:hypothetical protein M569_12148 [Genlisea aurea]
MPSLLVIFSFLFLLSPTHSLEDRHHGLAGEIPITMSPAAYDFFHHQNGIQPHGNGGASGGGYCDSSTDAFPPSTTTTSMQSIPTGLSPSSLPEAAPLHSSGQGGGGKLRAGGIAGIAVGFVLLCLVGMMGVVHLAMVKREMKNKSLIMEV